MTHPFWWSCLMQLITSALQNNWLASVRYESPYAAYSLTGFASIHQSYEVRRPSEAFCRCGLTPLDGLLSDGHGSAVTAVP